MFGINSASEAFKHDLFMVNYVTGKYMVLSDALNCAPSKHVDEIADEDATAQVNLIASNLPIQYVTLLNYE